MKGKPSEPAENDGRSERRQIGLQMTALGLEFAGSVLGGLALGYYLDRWLGTEPWLLLLGTFGGMITAVSRILHLTRRFDKQIDRRHDE